MNRRTLAFLKKKRNEKNTEGAMSGKSKASYRCHSIEMSRSFGIAALTRVAYYDRKLENQKKQLNLPLSIGKV